MGDNYNGSESAEDGMNSIALNTAIASGNLKAVEELIKAGVDVNAKTQDGLPLHIAAEKGHLKIVEKLIEKDAKLEAADNYGWTALHIAVQENHLKNCRKTDCTWC